MAHCRRSAPLGVSDLSECLPCRPNEAVTSSYGNRVDLPRVVRGTQHVLGVSDDLGGTLKRNPLHRLGSLKPRCSHSVLRFLGDRDAAGRRPDFHGDSQVLAGIHELHVRLPPKLTRTAIALVRVRQAQNFKLGIRLTLGCCPRCIRLTLGSRPRRLRRTLRRLTGYIRLTLGCPNCEKAGDRARQYSCTCGYGRNDQLPTHSEESGGPSCRKSAA